MFPQDVEDKVEKTFPNPIYKWAIQEARGVLEKGKKKSVVLPVEKVHNLLVKVSIVSAGSESHASWKIHGHKCIHWPKHSCINSY